MFILAGVAGQHGVNLTGNSYLQREFQHGLWKLSESAPAAKVITKSSGGRCS